MSGKRLYLNPMQGAHTRMEVMTFLRGLCTTNDNGCWLLPGGDSNKSGHKRVQFEGVTYGAHVFPYETLVGQVPTGLDLDHTCEETACINQEHLDPCTRGENIRRYKARRTCCKRGHPLEGDNLYMTSKGYRQCKACVRLRGREYYQRVKGASC